MLALLATTGRSDEGSPSTRELDSRIDRAIYQTVNLGAVIFNQGDHAGCYRLYQGALLSLEPMLAHRAGVRQDVAKGLRDVDALPSYTQRAIELRRVLDNVLTAVRSGPAQAAMAARPLWDRLGGEAAVKAVVHDFVVLAAADPKVDFFRGGKYTLDAEGVANLERLLVELIDPPSAAGRSSMRGGHEVVARGDGDHRGAVRRHRGRPGLGAQQVPGAEEGGR